MPAHRGFSHVAGTITNADRINARKLRQEAKQERKAIRQQEYEARRAAGIVGPELEEIGPAGVAPWPV